MTEIGPHLIAHQSIQFTYNCYQPRNNNTSTKRKTCHRPERSCPQNWSHPQNREPSNQSMVPPTVCASSTRSTQSHQSRQYARLLSNTSTRSGAPAGIPVATGSNKKPNPPRHPSGALDQSSEADVPSTKLQRTRSKQWRVARENSVSRTGNTTPNRPACLTAPCADTVNAGSPLS
jgi:hypothetical protein